MSSVELLNWSRGPALQIAIGIFLLGVVVRILEIFLLGRHRDLSVARGSAVKGGLGTIFTRSVPRRGLWSNSIAGYTWHIGLFLVVVFFAPHIQFFRGSLGLNWPAMGNAFIDTISLVSIVAMVTTLFMRITDPVRRMLSTFEDYFAWTVTFLPLLTGYITIHRLIPDYNLMLAIHILSLCLLLIVFPFTKLMHGLSTFFARWYNGAMAGRRGVRA
jgi:nitrate reductase gamma subunit